MSQGQRYPLDEAKEKAQQLVGVRFVPPEYRSVHWYKKVQAADNTLNRQS